VQGKGLGFQEAHSLEAMGLDLSTLEAEQPGKRVKRRKWGPVAGLQQHNTAVTRLPHKDNTYGLGYDPFANAEEFRVARKRYREEADAAKGPKRDRQGAHDTHGQTGLCAASVCAALSNSFDHVRLQRCHRTEAL
jgi:hypothetical protein